VTYKAYENRPALIALTTGTFAGTRRRSQSSPTKACATSKRAKHGSIAAVPLAFAASESSDVPLYQQIVNRIRTFSV
jgi:hypothetical protein